MRNSPTNGSTESDPMPSNPTHWELYPQTQPETLRSLRDTTINSVREPTTSPSTSAIAAASNRTAEPRDNTDATSSVLNQRRHHQINPPLNRSHRKIVGEESTPPLTKTEPVSPPHLKFQDRRPSLKHFSHNPRSKSGRKGKIAFKEREERVLLQERLSFLLRGKNSGEFRFHSSLNLSLSFRFAETTKSKEISDELDNGIHMTAKKKNLLKKKTRRRAKVAKSSKKGEVNSSPEKGIEIPSPPPEPESTSQGSMDPIEEGNIGEGCEELPPRLFALDKYPTETKINAYSKPEYLADIATALIGTEEMAFLLSSPFGELFNIPPNMVSFSGKLVLGLICRQLVTKKRYEMWMVFGGHPLRFGLREFYRITGLECGKYPKKKAVEEVVTVKKGCTSVWKTLFGDKSPTIDDLVKQRVRPVSKTVEMTKDLDFFCKYPWGRLAFNRTLDKISRFKSAKKIEDVIIGCKQQSYMRSIKNLAKMHPIRTSSILECEAADQVDVTYIVDPEDTDCPESLVWKKEVEDHRVDYILSKLIDVHKWSENTWVGGHDECPKQLRPEEKEHWVGLSIHLKMRHVSIYDPLVSKTRESVVKTRMQPILDMMPYLLKEVCKDYVGQNYSLAPFTYFRVDYISQNPRTGDCGPFSMKFLELLMLGCTMSDLQTISEDDMDNYRKGYAVDIFEHGVRSGPRGRDIVYRADVLKDANIYSLCSDPNDFHAAGHDTNDIRTEGRYRPFFERCLHVGNPIAIYHEGLRLITHESDIKGAIVLLQRNVPSHADATLACAILSICDGNAVMGAEYLRMFERNHYSLKSEETRDMCEELLDEIKKYGVTYKNTYASRFSYPEFRGFSTPHCAMMCYISH
ncbi:Ulp1 protease family C-terminal catalytic domain [Arabidopsis thaliana x Arabidopsis arenosa]|uniref:Ulp1 protease family C-terminal catalytic domain n=1 Tax=Arabidopsis thaliana x Arabidopsis arenosa TaxID=1240361 RepID=A0A8T1YE18_9BRAS|nr:Ulp1 protease family C-terminal catalytic domain [Arabidopsis thaliana x Arabidopsis arenosa]